MKIVPVIVAVLMLSACFATGKLVPVEKIEQLKPGVTTYQDVVSQFGEPTNSTLQSDGLRTVNYSYYQSQANAADFIPYARVLFGGSQSENSSVTLSFDKNGILTNYFSSSGKTSTGTGLISGQRQ